MNPPLIIAVSQRVDLVPARAERRDALDQRITAWLCALGGLPLLVPNTLGGELVQWLGAMKPAGILLSGGNDLGGSPERDNTEAMLLQHAERTGLPVLGICRGMQMLAHHAGGALVPVANHAGTRHPLQLMANATETLPCEVNSFHNWGISVCPPGYAPLATAPDGSIEAMRHREFRWEAWMWHPEREVRFGEIELARARQLLAGGI